MKQCPKCGTEMRDDAAFCTKCGAELYRQHNTAAYFRFREIDFTKTDGFSVAAYAVSMFGIFTFGLIAGFLGSIFALIGIHRIAKRRTDGMGLAVAGLTVGLADVLFALIYMVSLLFG